MFSAAQPLDLLLKYAQRDQSEGAGRRRFGSFQAMTGASAEAFFLFGFQR